MAFFKNFPTREFTLDNNSEIINIKDIFRHVDVDDLAIDPFSTYTYYDIGSSDRPDVVSQRLYGTTDFYWTFFILNDYLKEGIGAWPKSDQELERHITEQYDKYSVMQFLPGTLDTYEGLQTIESFIGASESDGFYNNTFQGLDLSHDYLRIRKPSNNGYALIDRFDTSLFQLYVHKVSNPQGFFSLAGRYGIETYNPYSAQNPLHEEVEQLNDAWLEGALAWSLEGHPSLTNPILVDAPTDSRRAYLRYFQENVLMAGAFLGWTANRIFEKGRNAHVFYSNSLTGDPMTAYDVYCGPYTSVTHAQGAEYNLIPEGTTLYGGGDSTNMLTNGYRSHGVNIQTRYDVEVEKNFAKRKLRVVKKSQINAFVEEYKKKLV